MEVYVRQYPDTWDWLFAQAGVIIKLAEVAEARKDPGAADRFRAAVRSLESLSLRDSQNLVALSVLGYALNGLGQALIDGKSFDDALLSLIRSGAADREDAVRHADSPSDLLLRLRLAEAGTIPRAEMRQLRLV